VAYRTIVVDGKTYKYVVGETHVKVSGVGCWPKQEVGKKIRVWQYCDCCGEALSDLYSSHVDPVRLAVTPKDVEQQIRAHA
jgi:hypothetical protein